VQPEVTLAFKAEDVAGCAEEQCLPPLPVFVQVDGGEVRGGQLLLSSCWTQVLLGRQQPLSDVRYDAPYFG
jgi:hypothetical protein